MKIPVGYLVKYTVLGICKFFRTACPIVIYLSEFLRKLIFYRIWIKIKNIALKLFFTIVKRLNKLLYCRNKRNVSFPYMGGGGVKIQQTIQIKLKYTKIKVT